MGDPATVMLWAMAVILCGVAGVIFMCCIGVMWGIFTLIKESCNSSADTKKKTYQNEMDITNHFKR